MTLENIEISVVLNINWWNKYPRYNILLDDKRIPIKNEPTKSLILFQKTFTTAPLARGMHKLEIEFIKDQDGLFKSEDGQIVNDTFLMVLNISFNGFSLRSSNLLTTKSYILSDNKKISVENYPIALSETSRFVFEFETPFAYWALREM